jgi:hypothetical protein
VAKRKKVYACKVCNAYVTRDAEGAVPLCFGQHKATTDRFDSEFIREDGVACCRCL